MSACHGAPAADARRAGKALSKINPRIICAFGSGFGQSGPLSHKGGQDILAQALSGVMARKPDQSLPTSVYATAASRAGHSARLDAAREDRRRPGPLGVALRVHAFPLTGVFETTDGELVIVGAFKANPLQDIRRALGLPDLSADPNYATFAKRVENDGPLDRQARGLFEAGVTGWGSPGGIDLEHISTLDAPLVTTLRPEKS